jgi:hypothetical protein
MREFRLLPRCKWDLHSFGIVCSVEWWDRTDVSGPKIVEFIFTHLHLNAETIQDFEKLRIDLGIYAITRTVVRPPTLRVLTAQMLSHNTVCFFYGGAKYDNCHVMSLRAQDF